MTAPHFFVERIEGPTVALSAVDSRHALRSLRLRPGEEVTLSDGAGLLARGRLRGEEGGLAVVGVEDVRPVPRPSPRLSVALAPPKGDRLAWAVQKLAELGVDEVVLVDSDRSVRAWDPEGEARALDRLRRVAREAAMQARRPFVPELVAGVAFREALEGGVTPVVLMQSGESPLARAIPAGPRAVRLVVGPEGGFSPQEADLAGSVGAIRATLGEGVLRTETAAVVGAALVLSRYGRLG